MQRPEDAGDRLADLVGGAALEPDRRRARDDVPHRGAVEVRQRDADQTEHDQQDADDRRHHLVAEQGSLHGADAISGALASSGSSLSGVAAATRSSSSRAQRHHRNTANPPNTHHSTA